MTNKKHPTSRGSIHKNPHRGTWEFVVWVIDPETPKGKRQVRRKGFVTRKQAEEALGQLHAQIRTAIRDGQQIVRRHDTLEHFLTTHWLPVIIANGKLKPSTISYYRFTSKYLIAGLGSKSLEDLTGGDLTRIYATLAKQGRSRSLVRGVHTTAHKALEFAVREGLITWNPATRADAPPTTKGRPKAWNDEEMRKIFEVADADRYWAAWRLLAATGLRRGELCGLKWEDISENHLIVERTRLVVDGKVIDGTPKTAKSHRMVPLNKIAIDTLKVWKIAQHEELAQLQNANPDGWIFTNAIGGPVDPGHLTKRWGNIVRQAEVEHHSLHALRHTFATSLLARHKSPKVVQDLLGHSSISVTLDLYTAVVDELGFDAVTALEDQFQNRVAPLNP